MALDTINVPLNLGVRRDLTELASAEQPALSICNNAAFYSEGQVSLRPCFVGADGQTLNRFVDPDLPATVDSSVATNSGERIGLSSHDGDPLLQSVGRIYRKRGTVWKDGGPFWSVRADYDEMIGELAETVGPVDPSFQAHTGATVFAFPSVSPATEYVDVEQGYPADPSFFPSLNTDNRCAAGAALFRTQGEDIYMSSGFPTVSHVVFSSDALSDPSVVTPQRLWACLSEDGTNYYVIFTDLMATTTLLRLSLAGAVLNTVILSGGNFSGTNPNVSLSVSCNATHVFAGAALASGGTTRIDTRSVLVSSWTDTGLNVSYVPAVSDGYRNLGSCVSTAGVATFAAQTSSGSIDILTRSMTTSAAAVLRRRLHGPDPVVTIERKTVWSMLFPPTRLASGKTVMGVLVFDNDFGFASPATWIVLDISQTEANIVAAGEEGLALFQTGIGAAHATSTGGVSFGFLRGILFDANKILRAKAQRVTLTPVPAGAVTVNGLTIHTGQYCHAFDGEVAFPVGHPVSPGMRVTDGVGGTLIPGSRTLQACWSFTDAVGNTHRSPPSNAVTISLGGGADKLVATITTPQWLGSLAPSDVVVELYSTDANPSASADKYLVVKQALTTFDQNSITLTFDTDPLPSISSELALYTGGNILPNERAFGNNGLAVVGSRVWSAEGQTAYASKLIRPGSAPAWSTDDSLHVNVPSGYGEIRGLGGLDNMLVIICEEATLVFQGNGPGDAGGPSDFSEPRRVYRARGPVNPCDVAEAATSVVWSSRTGEAHALSPGGAGVNIGRPVQSAILSRPVYTPAGPTGNELLLFRTAQAGTLEVLDMRLGQWSTWIFPFDILDVTGAEDRQYLLIDEAPWVGRLIQGFAADNTVAESTPVQMRLRTRLIPLGHLGRVRSIKPLGKADDSGTEMTIAVYSDQHQTLLTGNGLPFVLDSNTEEWPRSELPELRLGVQRMESFSVEITTSGGIVTLTGIQAEVKDTLANPRNSRQ